jgi:hypothetical protein
LAQNPRVEQGDFCGRAGEMPWEQALRFTADQLRVEADLLYHLIVGKPGGRVLGTLLGRARIVALGVVLALAGCVTTENSLSQADIASMKLTGVTVSYTPTAFIQWEDGVRAYAASKGSADTAVPSVARTPEGKAYVQNLLASRIKAGIERAMAGPA